MFQDYLEFKCIKQMNDDIKGRFTNIVNEYAGRLNKVESDGGTVYTLHDFDHHCLNLFKIVSNVILNIKTAFGQNENSITQWELYILNLAILLHDVGMTPHVDLARDDHSVQSARIIREEYENESNPLSESKSGLQNNDIEALALIVKAHSDVKGRNVNEEENGLNDPELTNSMEGRFGKIRARFLANILRLADELDVTTARLGHKDAYNDLKKAIQKKPMLEKKLEVAEDEETKADLIKEIERCKRASFSYRRWERLRYFKAVTCDQAGKVTLTIDDSTVLLKLEQGENEGALAEEIWEVYEKIAKEFDKFNKDINSDLQFAAMVAIKEFSYDTKEKRIKKALDKLKKKTKPAIISAGINPHVISTELESKISAFIEKRNLLEVGHFKLHDDLCARDWISIEEIISTENFFKKCQTQLLLHLKALEKSDEKYIIIGVDFYGMIIASRLAFILQKPYTYLIPEFRTPNSSTKEIDFSISIDEFDSVVIVTDVIVTFDTINKMIEKYNLQNKIKAIYAILFRGTYDNQYIVDNEEIVKLTHVLNSKYNIEIQTNDNCRYKDDEQHCKALNKTYN